MKTKISKLSGKTINPQLGAFPDKGNISSAGKNLKAKPAEDHKPETDGKIDKLERKKQLLEKIDREIRKMHTELSILNPEQNKMFSEVLLFRLTKKASCKEIATNTSEEMKAANNIEKMLLDQMSAAHVLSMKWIGQIYNEEKPFSLELGNTVINASARLMEVYQKGAVTLHKLRTGGKQTVVVKHQHVHVSEGGQALITDEYKQGVKGYNSKK